MIRKTRRCGGNDVEGETTNSGKSKGGQLGHKSHAVEANHWRGNKTHVYSSLYTNPSNRSKSYDLCSLHCIVVHRNGNLQRNFMSRYISQNVVYRLDFYGNSYFWRYS